MKRTLCALLALTLVLLCGVSLAETSKAHAASQIYYDVYSADWATLNYMYESLSLIHI